MIEFSEADTSELLGIFLVANTPNYVLKHFRSCSCVQRLCDQYRTEEFVEWFAFRHAPFSVSRIDEATVYAYALLVALSFKPFEEIISAFDQIDVSGLLWGNYIKEWIKKSYKPTHIVNVNVPATVNLENEKNRRISLANNTFESISLLESGD